MQHNNVASTCTLTHLTGWSISNLNSADKKTALNTQLKTVDEMMRLGFKRDFVGIIATTTQYQERNYGVNNFIQKCGFEKSFSGEKDGEKHRHKESGDVTLWTVTPEVYEKSLRSFHKELTELKDKIDPPKKPDPARQKVPELLLSKLRKAKIVFDNAAVDNRLETVLMVPRKAAEMHIKLEFGIDIRKWNNYGDNWTRISTRRLKEDQKLWKAELV